MRIKREKRQTEREREREGERERERERAREREREADRQTDRDRQTESRNNITLFQHYNRQKDGRELSPQGIVIGRELCRGELCAGNCARGIARGELTWNRRAPPHTLGSEPSTHHQLEAFISTGAPLHFTHWGLQGATSYTRVRAFNAPPVRNF